MKYINGPEDPEARFIAKTLHLFRGKVNEY
jgi:hypothetical protein